MGFLDKIKSIFFGPDYDKDIRNLSKRISELNAEKRMHRTALCFLSITYPLFRVCSARNCDSGRHK